ncbi:MAG: hypothetical protein QOJ31_1478 [Gaiellales bacterium]|nr:hypothetical protein [Gaiellales bacterium]MDX6550794.1 hypothetical protein [Gaiellales bacterium]
MRYLIAFGLFWYDFVVGDDWSIAVGVVAAIAVAALLVNAGMNAFWLVPLAVAGLLAASLWRVSGSEG